MSSESARSEKLGFGDFTIPETDVSVYDALYRRRMAWDFTDQPVPRDALDRMLATAVWAPNHRLTEPWRFFILERGSAASEKVAALAYEFALQRSGNERRAEATRDSLLKTPVLIYAYSTPGRDEEGTKENYASVCCAAHNMALAGVAEGLAVTWETGGPTRHADLARTLGAEDDWTLATMLSVGFPAESPASERTPVTNSSSGWNSSLRPNTDKEAPCPLSGATTGTGMRPSLRAWSPSASLMPLTAATI